MKIVQINAVDGILSTGRTTKELSDSLLMKGIDCRVYVGDNMKRESYDICVGTKLDHKLHALLSRITGLQGYYSKRPTRRIIHELHLFEPDIVHLRNLHANYINLPMILKYLAENHIATVISLHDCFMFTGKCFYPSDANCDKWKSSCHNCKIKNSGNPSWLFDRCKKMYRDKQKYLTANKFLTVIGVSHWITEQAKESFLHNSATIIEIFNWIDMEKFYPRIKNNVRKKYKFNNKPIILGVAAYWNHEKGLDDFKKIADILGGNVNVVLVGNVPEEYDVGNLKCIGLLESIDDLADIYSEATVFFNPSRRETFGKVTAEAMACGCPAVVYKNTALPELVREGCGYVVETGNLAESANKIEVVINNSKNFYSANCINHVKKNFDKNKNIERTLDAYRNLIEKKCNRI